MARLSAFTLRTSQTAAWIGFAVALLASCNEQSKPSIPDTQTMNQLVTGTTLEFARGVASGNLTGFYGSTARDFQARFTADQFNNAFAGFIQQKINMMAVQEQAPVFEKPTKLLDDGTLTVAGYYPTAPSRVHFDYSYKLDPDEWKITGIDIRVEPQN